MSSQRLKQITVVALLSLIPAAALAQNAEHSPPGPALSAGFKFSERSGEELYANV